MMISRGGVVWPQLLPGNIKGRLVDRRNGPPGSASFNEKVQTAGNYKRLGTLHREPQGSHVFPSVRPGTFSMVEDRLLCR